MGLKGLQSIWRLRRRWANARAGSRDPDNRRRRKGKVSLQVAQTAEELETAYALVQAQYLRRGYAKPGGAVRFVSHCCTPDTHTLVVRIGDAVIATASVIVDGPFGLPLETTYPGEVEALRSAGERLAEISCLATRRRGDARALLALYRGIYALARFQYGIDRLCITVHPRQRKFYQRALLFEVIGPERGYAACNHAPAVALGLDLQHAEQRFRGTHGWGWLSRYFLGRGDLSEVARTLRAAQAGSARLRFARRQPDWQFLDCATRQRIEASYPEA